jgi:hypothetical protein
MNVRSWMLVILFVPVAVATGVTDEAVQPAVKRVHEMAEPPVTGRGIPRASTVSMRSLRPRPLNARDPHDTLAAIRGFHVSRLEWTYGDNVAFVGKVHDLGVEYGGAVAAGSYVGTAPPVEWNVVGIDGQRLVAPWMRQWPRPNPWGCANNPEFRAGHLRAALAAVAAGADLLQRDEPAQNLLATSWGGCFCRHCIAGFRTWLASNADPQLLTNLGIDDPSAFDYAAHLRATGAPGGDAFGRWPGDPLKRLFVEFQTASTVEFHAWWRQELDRAAGRPVPVWCNNSVRHWRPIELGFDSCIGELQAKHATPAHLHAVMREARRAGRIQATTMPLLPAKTTAEHETPEWIALTRRTIATVYALGGLIEMPWDTYLPVSDAQRYFGEPRHYADLTAFVRGIAPQLDGHTEAYATGAGVGNEHAATAAHLPPLDLGTTAADVLAVVRVPLDRPAAPAVVHLVDWRDEPRPFRLMLRPAAFGPADVTPARLLRPVDAYDAAAHDLAFSNRDYGPLVREEPLPVATDGSVDVPALAPWGVIVVGSAD